MGAAGTGHDGPWPAGTGDRHWLRAAKRTGNPLLRRPTASELRARRGAVVLLAVVALAVGLGAALVYRSGTAAERADADRRPVTATVLPQPVPTTAESAYLSQATLQVSYPFDGATRTSNVPTLFGAAAGTGLDAWVDRDGLLVSRPQTRAVTLAQTGLVVVGGLVLLISLALGARAALEAWSARLRDREWEAEWLELDLGRSR